MAFILNIDSALETASVSISKDGVIQNLYSNHTQKDHAAFIHTAVEKSLEASQISAAQLNAIACTIGPGSYTGLRVGLAAAKGLCYALNKPLITLSTLQVMAQAAIINNNQNEGYYYCPMIDARRMEVFTAMYKADLSTVTEPEAKIIDAHSFDFALSTKPTYFFGNGMQKFKNICTNTNAHFIEMGETFEAINIISTQLYKKQSFANLVMAAPSYTKEFYNP
ncbi:tRNA (adenosine(37)-N6)-threonylcarbamoyltransferase complex dimerization subunit type 1 TsaB [Ferruginibacter yonginensis]|uniref:tRNA (Adenosine(37)-N6)-threonylcarbamoyltransferase complex dimerization subunit type 1 TsaB n=1 Tax=Ferruginibacter yonginensis TaxID=1310416 RepID=A0ABV8QQJ2_9BACT